MADDLEQARETVLDWLLRGVDNLDSVDALADLDTYLAAVRRDERLRCWREVRSTTAELSREDSPLSTCLGDFSGPGFEDVRWPVAVDRLVVPDEFLRPFARFRNDPEDW